MYLKKIVLLGFKSFADKTVLTFQPGITSIVGPNGCGKSNISDAFRWVLGEQSAKSMRGSKMMDVIFAGTSKRKPLNMCEITLTFSDVGERLGVDYSDVEVTRRLHRSGESEYFINRKQVRLKDMHDLFLDSGIGKNAFAIFEQGKIDQVINYSPLERRAIFEEASGILRFLQRKREALRKLEHVDNNLERVHDIHTEVEKQIVVLEEQAAIAKVYKENCAQFENLENALFVAKWDRWTAKREEIEKNKKDKEESCKEEQQTLTMLTTKLSEEKKGLEHTRASYQEKRDATYQIKHDLAVISQQKQAQKERKRELEEKEKQWQFDLQQLLDKRKVWGKEKESLQKDHVQCQSALEDADKLLKEQKELVASIDDEVRGLRASQKTVESERYRLVQTEKQTESELKQLSLRLEHCQERQKQLLTSKETREKACEEFHLSAGEQESEVTKMTAEVEKAKHELKEKETAYAVLYEKGNDLQSTLHHKQKKVAEGKARHHVLMRLREEKQGFSPASKRLLKEANTKSSSLYKKIIGLYELVVPEGDQAAALAMVMRPYAQTLVVQSKDDYEETLAFAKQHNLKDFSLICQELIEESAAESIVVKGATPLITQVTDHQLAKHLLKNVYIANDMQAALNVGSGKSAWTDEGLFVDEYGVIFYMTQGENHVFLREAELKKLERELKKEEKEAVEIEQKLEEHKQALNALSEEKKVFGEHLRKQEMALMEANYALRRVLSDLEKGKIELEALCKESSVLEGTMKEIAEKTDILQCNYRDLEKQNLSIQGAYQKAIDRLEQLTQQLHKEQQKLTQSDQKHRELLDKQRKLSHDLHVFDVKEEEGLTQQKRIEAEVGKGLELLREIEQKDQKYEEILAQLKESLQACEAVLEKSKENLSRRQLELTQSEEQLEKLRGQLKMKEEEGYQLGIQSAQIDATIASLESELAERYHVTVVEAREKSTPLEESIEKSERKLRRLRSEVENAGDINMTSIEEFEKHKTRYSFLQQQIADLTEAKQELVQIITRLDTESRKIFQEMFEQIRANFRKNFEILFNGGEADLQFTELGDILEAGIEIVAKPPGKRMQSIQLLSGGEKCLTAMALLFAIFEVRPAPFCILDEIDAPLDDANVDRFLRVVKQFVDRCQFIIITHNKGTMEMADVLFGVSMQEKGVSQVLSIEFSEDEPILVR